MNEKKYFEVQLRSWKKSTSNNAPEVTFRFQSDEELEYFEQYTIAKGKQAGQLFDIAVQISDQDDQSKEKPKGGKLSRDAAMLCKDPKFQRYVSICITGPVKWGSDEESATNFIKVYCKIQSRAELDSNEEAAKIFKRIHHAYSQWAQA